MKRLLNPATNPAGYTAAAAAIYALIQALARGQTIADPQVYLPLVMAVVSFVGRQYVTPVKDPRDGNGAPLVPSKPAPSPSGSVPPAAVQPPATGTGPTTP